MGILKTLFDFDLCVGVDGAEDGVGVGSDVGDPVGDGNLVFADLGERLSRRRAVKCLTLVVDAIAENYIEYRDYNATRTPTHSLTDNNRRKNKSSIAGLWPAICLLSFFACRLVRFVGVRAAYWILAGGLRPTARWLF